METAHLVLRSCIIALWAISTGPGRACNPVLSPAQAGFSLQRLLQEYGHCVIARELLEGASSFEALFAFAESITGQVG